ncbi:MAG TPA: HAD family hydrolase [Opitutaceae bacterium]|jgi:phosphoglycolate phosphatase|nr:HAD family hydrolase [Opitutaceae bacterium]
MFVCLFDIDGTLLSSGGAGKAAMAEGMATAFGVPAYADGIPFSGRTDRAIARDLFHHHGVAESPENWRRFVTAYLSHLPDCLNRHDGKVLPGIASLLDSLQVRGNVAIGLLTGNIRDGARLKLGHYGLYQHFAFGGFGDEHFQRDDVARDALAEVQRHLDGNVNLDQVWVIGDTPLDVQCARAIGARVAAVASGWHSLEDLAAAKPDLLLADLSDAGPLLDFF